MFYSVDVTFSTSCKALLGKKSRSLNFTLFLSDIVLAKAGEFRRFKRKGQVGDRMKRGEQG